MQGCVKGTGVSGGTVYILHDGSLMAGGVENLLRGAPGLTVVGTAPADRDVEAILETVRPDVLIVVGDLSDRNARNVLECMRWPSAPKVVRIGPDTDRIVVHRSESLAGTRMEDLLAAIRPLVPEPPVPVGAGAPVHT